MSYENFSHFAGTWGLVFLVVMFVGAFAYALWPGNRSAFKRAAHSPLNDDAIEETTDGR